LLRLIDMTGEEPPPPAPKPPSDSGSMLDMIER